MDTPFPLFHSLEKSIVVHFPPVLFFEQTGADIKLHEPFCARGGNTDSKDPGPISRAVSPSEPVRISVSIHTPIHVIIPALIDISLCAFGWQGAQGHLVWSDWYIGCSK